MNELQQIVESHLKNLIVNKDQELTDLLCSLGYEFQNEDLTFRTQRWTENQRSLIDKLTLLASHNGFSVFWVRMNKNKLLRTPERTIINKLTSEFPYNMIVLSNSDDSQWDFVNMKLVKEVETEENKDPRKRQILRRIRIEEIERLHTATQRIAMLSVPEDGASNLELQKRHDDAFDVEAVSEAFFKHFQQVFSRLRDSLADQTGDKEWAHAYTLQFLNRLMFIYFIQKNRWLGDDPEFVRSYWDTYQESDQLNDTFVEKWLSILFFEAFNKKFSHPRWLPDEYRQILQMAPFLNGGLFKREDKLDAKYSVKITDSQFSEVFDFLQHYNFTITEDSPIEREVAVDPEMIGKVYESLVNVSDEVDERGEAGIFYTPRTEITLMCRLALVDRLTSEFGAENKNRFYELIFAFLLEDKDAADEVIAEVNLWPDLSRFLRDITVVDPAVGSGSFLVGMLNILTDLIKRSNKQLGSDERDFDIKKRIIGQSLYGVDVMEWAVYVCELRLWLQLVVETDMKQEELTLQPLLPNLSFKIRPGDSVVQEVGGVNMAHLHLSGLSPAIKGKITGLKGEKMKFFNNDPTGKFKSQKAVEQEELNLFREILHSKIKANDDRLLAIKRTIAEAWDQEHLFGEKKMKQASTLVAAYASEIEELNVEKERIVEARMVLKGRENIPFVWDVSFSEIFEGDKRGFDIVVGNPPYVRQEKIADPKDDPDDFGGETNAAWKAAKRAYKDKLMNSVYHTYPRFFHYKEKDEKARRKMDAKNDLYVYFYLHGLSLLNEKGSFCFVTSNSWLDVGYGKDLQEFLIKQVPVKMILDNQVKRTFKSADVNTVICLFGSPIFSSQSPAANDQSARFVMFYVPFENVLDPVIFEEIEDATERTTKPEYRVVPKKKDELFEGGLDKERAKTKRIDAYTGDKWGGKYLRAPDIYFTILEKGKDKLVRLGDIAEVRRGFTTGANEFFYLTQEKIDEWGIEEEFLKPFLFSLKEIESYEVYQNRLKRKIFTCNDNIHQLVKNNKTGAINYIKWGESKKFNLRPSVLSRKLWYSLGDQPKNDFVSNRFLGKRFGFPLLADTVACDVFFVGRFNNDLKVNIALLNSTLTFLVAEIISRKTYGIGVAYLYGPEINAVLLPKVDILTEKSKKNLQKEFNNMRGRRILNIEEEIQQPDRKALDDIVFDAIGLTPAERKEVYWAVCELVQRRLEKARSM